MEIGKIGKSHYMKTQQYNWDFMRFEIECSRPSKINCAAKSQFDTCLDKINCIRKGQLQFSVASTQVERLAKSLLRVLVSINAARMIDLDSFGQNAKFDDALS